MSEATSSWLTPQEPQPGDAPRMAQLPPNVTRAIPVGEPQPPLVVSAAPPAPAAPTEAEARRRLAELQQAQREAEAASDAAVAALLRAQQHVEACRAEVEVFNDIDAQLRELHVEALRGGDIRPQITVPPELRQRISEHEQARLALDAAIGAVPVFEREAGVGRDAASAARIAVSNTADQLVARHALAMLAKRNEVARELEALDAAVLAYEQFAKPAPRAITNYAMELYASGKTRVALLDTGRWRGLHQRLTADPEAPLSLT
jgi:hypothetical protein